MKDLKRILLLGLGSTLAAGLTAQTQLPTQPGTGPQEGLQSAPGGEAAEVQQEMQQVAMELQSLSQRIQSVQQQAREDEAVEQALLDYGRTLRDEMIEIAPDKEEQIRRKTELLEEIVTTDTSSLDTQDQEGFGEVLQEHQQLRQELNEVEVQAAQVETVQEKEQTARNIHIAKMEELEPELMNLVQQANQLNSRLQQLQQQLQTTGS